MSQEVRLVMAISADGKIAPGRDRSPHFGPADAYRFERVCAESDALVSGAGTLRASGRTRSIVTPDLVAWRAAHDLPPQPFSVIVTRSGNLDPSLPYFTEQPLQRAIATTDARATEMAADYADLAELWPCGAEEVEPQRILAHLAARGHQRIALLGGGELNASWFAADLVDRIELTVAPLLFGGRDAPTPIDGDGLSAAGQLSLVSCDVVEGCIFVTYDVQRGV